MPAVESYTCRFPVLCAAADAADDREMNSGHVNAVKDRKKPRRRSKEKADLKVTGIENES